MAEYYLFITYDGYELSIAPKKKLYFTPSGVNLQDRVEIDILWSAFNL